MFRHVLAVLTLTAVTLTTPAAAHAGTTYRGTGDDVIRIRTTKNPGLIRFTHDGPSNFIVHTVNPQGRTGEYLVNEIGRYRGTVLYNDYGSTGTSALEIKADGSWTATFLPVGKARCWCSATVRGTGDRCSALPRPRPAHRARRA